MREAGKVDAVSWEARVILAMLCPLVELLNLMREAGTLNAVS